MLNHVLVPIDGSELAERALEYVRKVTTKNSKITLLTAIDVPEYTMVPFYPMPAPYDGISDVLDSQVIPQTEEYLEKVAASLRHEGYMVHTEAVIGEAANVIVERAEELKVDAIVMSTHGRSGISRWLLGSIAQKVLSAGICPVFIIPMQHG